MYGGKLFQTNFDLFSLVSIKRKKSRNEMKNIKIKDSEIMVLKIKMIK